MKTLVPRGEFRAKTERAGKRASLVSAEHVAAWRPPPQEEQDRLAVPVLKRAWALVDGGWCQHAAWTDAKGRPHGIEGSGPPARFSLVAAVRACAPTDQWIQAEYAVRALRRRLGVIDLVAWNDHQLRTKRQVLAAIHGAVSMLLKEHRPRGGWHVTGGARPPPVLPALQLALPLEVESEGST